MNRTILVAAMLSVLLPGCFAGPPHVNGEKLGPGHCRQSGVVEISIQKFQRPPNATLTVKIQSLEQDTKDPNHEPIGTFIWLEIVGNDGSSNGYDGGHWAVPREHSWLGPNETATRIWELPDLPSTPWSRYAVSYHYHVGSRDHPTDLRCSLVGDNAPWAFETKP
jgi:hypothetical protein